LTCNQRNEQRGKVHVKKLKEKSSAATKRKPGAAVKLESAGAVLRQTRYFLCLYVSGSTSKSALAVTNIKRFCERYLKDRYDLKVIDVYQQPDLVRHERIVALPTLIKRLPFPLRRLIGDLSDQESVLLGLDLREAGAKGGK
jgi:circadian clock protein KaiB